MYELRNWFFDARGKGSQTLPVPPLLPPLKKATTKGSSHITTDLAWTGPDLVIFPVEGGVEMDGGVPGGRLEAC